MNTITEIFLCLITALISLVTRHQQRSTIPRILDGDKLSDQNTQSHIGCLLVPGLWASHTSLDLLGAQLSYFFSPKDVYKFTYSALSPTSRTIAQLTLCLKKLLKMYHRLVIVSHSFGGIIGSTVLKKFPESSRIFFITIASPLRGALLIDTYEYICRALSEGHLKQLARLLKRMEQRLGFHHLIMAIKTCPECPRTLASLHIVSTQDVVVGKKEYQYYNNNPTVMIDKGHVAITTSKETALTIRRCLGLLGMANTPKLITNATIKPNTPRA